MQDRHNPKPSVFEHHLAAVAEGWLPASAPIQKPTGEQGLATQAFPVNGLEGASELALSDNRALRGLAALLAIIEVRREVREGTDFFA